MAPKNGFFKKNVFLDKEGDKSPTTNNRTVMMSFSNSTPVLATEQLSFSYQPEAPQAEYIFNSLNFTLHAGECVAILGPSGVGKSTLINLLASLDSPTDGRIHYQLREGEYLLEKKALYQPGATRSVASRDELRSRFGFVFQTPFMLTSFDVRYNIGLPLRLKGHKESDIRPLVEDMVDKVELRPQADWTADKLSGGQRQRVAIARALVHQPDIVFADEPTGNLDGKKAEEIMKIFMELVEQKHTALILITHDPCVANYAQRLFYLEKTEGVPAQLQAKQWNQQSQIKQQCCHKMEEWLS